MAMASNRRTHEKRIAELKTELRNGLYPSNPKAATARFHIIAELAKLEGVSVREIKQRLRRGTL